MKSPVSTNNDCNIEITADINTKTDDVETQVLLTTDDLQGKQVENKEKVCNTQSKKMKNEDKGDYLQSKQMKNEDKRDHLQSKQMKK